MNVIPVKSLHIGGSHCTLKLKAKAISFIARKNAKTTLAPSVDHHHYEQLDVTGSVVTSGRFCACLFGLWSGLDMGWRGVAWRGVAWCGIFICHRKYNVISNEESHFHVVSLETFCERLSALNTIEGLMIRQ